MRAEVADHGAQRSRNKHADPVAEVRLGSFATGSRRQQARPCPLCPGRDQIQHRGEMTRMGWTGRAPTPNNREGRLGGV
jgi:hypothetical protein